MPAYNATQVFAAEAGFLYNIAVYAEAAGQPGVQSPMCTLTLCAETTCSETYNLTGTYARYAFVFAADVTNANALATIAIRCAAAAYVAD